MWCACVPVQFFPLPPSQQPPTVLWSTRTCTIDGHPFNFDEPSEAHTNAIVEFETHSQAIFSALTSRTPTPSRAKRKRDEVKPDVAFLKTAIATAIDKSTRASTQKIKDSLRAIAKQLEELITELEK